MESFSLILIWVFLLFSIPIQGRLFSYETKPHHLLAVSRISMPPSLAPEPAVSPSHNADSVKKKVTTVFNVLSFGAVGDGVSDDTQAFKMAWDTACQAEPEEKEEEEEAIVVLVPQRYSFMIQSTIFTGPCRSSKLTFQVNVVVKFVSYSFCCETKRITL